MMTAARTRRFPLFGISDAYGRILPCMLDTRAEHHVEPHRRTRWLLFPAGSESTSKAGYPNTVRRLRSLPSSHFQLMYS